MWIAGGAWYGLPLLVFNSAVTSYFVIRCHQVGQEQARRCERERREFKEAAEKAFAEQHGKTTKYENIPLA